MASTISTFSINIDEAFPVAGVDNESQGFRDNFDLIKTALTVANSEITDLQDTTAKINAANAFSGNQISNADLLTVTEVSVTKPAFDIGLLPVPILYSEAVNQQLEIQDNKTFLIDWKTSASVPLGNNRYARMVLHVKSTSSTVHDLDFSVEGGGDVLYEAGDTYPYQIGEDWTVLELWTYNNGQSMYIKRIGEFVLVP